jgi:UDP-N-acetylglucosamine 2-epimerase (non-hydrolysing)
MNGKMKIHLIAAARPNFMKIAPIYHGLKKESWANPAIIHSGQHYDLNMSDVFFKDLKMPEPHIHLGIGGGSHADQTGKVMIAYEKVLINEKPELVIVVGDVNATMACTITAAKINYDNQNQRPLIAHLEAGLRSFDRSMPEEINRIITDSLADILWTPSPDGDENLIKEGVEPGKIKRVGNIMLDSFEMLRKRINEQETYKELGLRPKAYAVVTLHRPSNVDDADNLNVLCKSLIEVADSIKLCFPVHPRTRNKLMQFGYYEMLSRSKNITLTEPLNYIRFMNLVVNSRLAITDSGGIQEETTYLRIPCLTMRENTERPITISQGTNRLCSAGNLLNDVHAAMKSNFSSINIPEMWDGNTADRVVSSIKTL